MFENVHLILNALNDPQYTNLSTNQMVIHVANVIELNNLSLKWLLFEMFIYTIYVIITSFYTYTIWSICKPVQTIQSINRMCSTVHYQIIPKEYRCYMYRQLLKTLVIDFIRLCIIGFIYFKIQKMFMW
jgi:hypothetical protein